MDGNKRVALAAAAHFLRWNGWKLEAEADDAEAMVLKVVTGEVDVAFIDEWIVGHVVSVPRPET